MCNSHYYRLNLRDVNIDLAFTLGSQNESIILDTLSFHLAVGEVKVSYQSSQSLKLGDKVKYVLSVSIMIREIILYFGVFRYISDIGMSNFFFLKINNDLVLPTHCYFENTDTVTTDKSMLLSGC